MEKKKGSDPSNLSRQQFEKGLTVFSSISQGPMSLALCTLKQYPSTKYDFRPRPNVAFFIIINIF